MTDKKYQPPKLLIPLDERGEHPFNLKDKAPLSESEREYFEKRDRLRYVSSNWHCLWNTLACAFNVDHDLKTSDEAVKEITERDFSRPEGLIVLANEIDDFLFDSRPQSENLDDLIEEGFSMAWDFDDWGEFADFLQKLKTASLAAAKGMSK